MTLLKETPFIMPCQVSQYLVALPAFCGMLVQDCSIWEAHLMLHEARKKFNKKVKITKTVNYNI